MTRQEMIEHIARLVNVNAYKQDIIDYPLTDKELYIRTLNELEKLTDDELNIELDIMIDKVWDAIKEIYSRE